MKANDPEKQQHFEAKCLPYHENIRRIKKIETEILEECRAAPESAAEKLFALANDMLDLASNYLAINSISLSVLDLRSEEILLEARKAISKTILYTEGIVTGKVDVPFSEYETNLNELSQISAQDKFSFARKTGFAIAYLKYSYGNNTKWQWLFVDIEGRFAAIAKNLLDLKKVFANNDPSSPDYTALLYHLHMVKDLLHGQANRYQERYALSSQQVDDLRLALNFISAARQLHLSLGEFHEAEELKKKYDVWHAAYTTAISKSSNKE